MCVCIHFKPYAITLYDVNMTFICTGKLNIMGLTLFRYLLYCGVQCGHDVVHMMTLGITKRTAYSTVISNIRKHHSVTNDSNWPIFAWKNTPPWIAVNQEISAQYILPGMGKSKPLLVSLLNTYSEFIFPLINISESYF